MKRDLLLHTAMAFLQGFPMLNCGDEIAQLNGWDYKNDPDRVEDSRNLHRSKFNWEDAKQRTRKGTLQNALWQGMEQLRQMRADPCFAPDAWVTTWDSHNPGVLALVRKRGEETLVGLFNFTEYPAGASLDALGGAYHTPEGTSVWLADVELEPYQALLVKINKENENHPDSFSKAKLPGWSFQRCHRAACIDTVQFKGLGAPNKYFAAQNSRLRSAAQQQKPQ